MSIESLYRGYGVRIETDDIVSTTIGGINNYRVSDNVQVNRDTTGGDIYSVTTSKIAHEEEIEITSLNVDRVLDVVGAAGVCLALDSTVTGFEFFLTKLDECQPGHSITGNNLRYAIKEAGAETISRGILHPGSLTIPHAGDSSITFMCIPKSDGSNAAIQVAENITLPAIPDTGKRFGMGPVTIDGTEYNGKQNVDINFGVSISKQSTDGDMFPSWVAIERVLAVITIRGIQPEWALAANIPRGGRSFAHIDTRIALRRKSPDAISGYFPDESEEHITITAKGKAYITEMASGNGTAPSQSTLVMYVEKDGSNAPLIIATNAALADTPESASEASEG